MRSRAYRWLLGIAAVVLFPPLARAQGVFDMGALTNTLSQDVLVQSERARARVGGKATRRRGNPAVLVYRPSQAVRARNLRQFVEKTRQTDPTTAQELQRTFAKTDVVAEIGRLMRPVGLNPNNLADATALYLVNAWYGARGSIDGKPADYRAVSAQLTRILAANPTLARASDASKQQAAEAMMLHALLTEQSVTAAKRQPANLPKVRAAIAQGAKASFGLDLAKLRLGANGFY